MDEIAPIEPKLLSFLTAITVPNRTKIAITAIMAAFA
jgi:hypothetical protein